MDDCDREWVQRTASGCAPSLSLKASSQGFLRGGPPKGGDGEAGWACSKSGPRQTGPGGVLDTSWEARRLSIPDAAATSSSSVRGSALGLSGSKLRRDSLLPASARGDSGLTEA